MASISKDPSGRFRVQFVAPDGTRKTLRLPTSDRRAAETIARYVDSLLAARLAGLPVSRETATWLGNLPELLRRRLAAVGLIDAGPELVTLREFLTQWLEGRRQAGYKPASLLCWEQAIRALLDHLNGSLRLANVTPQQAEAFRQRMVADGLRATTVHKRLQHARLFFRDAVRYGLIDRNPFEHVRHRCGNVAERRAYVPAADVLKIIERAPNVTWRVIIALSRFAGLRTPSETFSLKWEDVHWESGRLMVPCTKTEHLPGRDYRVVPLFPMLRPYLEEAWDAAPEGAVYVVPEEYRRRALGGQHWANANLRTTLEKIIRRAGLRPWPRLWHSLRASCETDLARAFPLPVVAKWIGNTPAVAMRHYVDVTDADFSRAVEWMPDGIIPSDAKSDAGAARKHCPPGAKSDAVSARSDWY